MKHGLIVVEGFVATAADDTNVAEDVWSLALDQRAFGPRRLVVAFAEATGRLISLSYTRRTSPPEVALGPCIDHIGRGAVAAVAFCDETVAEGPPPGDLADRFARARAVAAVWGVHLVDWIACDDQLFRSTRFALEPYGDWWDVPSAGGRGDPGRVRPTAPRSHHRRRPGRT